MLRQRTVPASDGTVTSLLLPLRRPTVVVLTLMAAALVGVHLVQTAPLFRLVTVPARDGGAKETLLPMEGDLPAATEGQAPAPSLAFSNSAPALDMEQLPESQFQVTTFELAQQDADAGRLIFRAVVHPVRVCVAGVSATDPVCGGTAVFAVLAERGNVLLAAGTATNANEDTVYAARMPNWNVTGKTTSPPSWAVEAELPPSAGTYTVIVFLELYNCPYLYADFGDMTEAKRMLLSDELPDVRRLFPSRFLHMPVTLGGNQTVVVTEPDASLALQRFVRRPWCTAATMRSLTGFWTVGNLLESHFFPYTCRLWPDLQMEAPRAAAEDRARFFGRAAASAFEEEQFSPTLAKRLYGEPAMLDDKWILILGDSNMRFSYGEMISKLGGHGPNATALAALPKGQRPTFMVTLSRSRRTAVCVHAWHPRIGGLDVLRTKITETGAALVANTSLVVEDDMDVFRNKTHPDILVFSVGSHSNYLVDSAAAAVRQDLLDLNVAAVDAAGILRVDPRVRLLLTIATAESLMNASIPAHNHLWITQTNARIRRANVGIARALPDVPVINLFEMSLAMALAGLYNDPAHGRTHHTSSLYGPLSQVIFNALVRLPPALAHHTDI